MKKHNLTTECPCDENLVVDIRYKNGMLYHERQAGRIRWNLVIEWCPSYPGVDIDAIHAKQKRIIGANEHDFSFYIEVNGVEFPATASYLYSPEVEAITGLPADFCQAGESESFEITKLVLDLGDGAEIDITPMLNDEAFREAATDDLIGAIKEQS